MTSRGAIIARRAVWAALFVAVIAFYVFIVSAGRRVGVVWPSWSAFYDTQAEGFRAGHLYALVPGPPGARHWDYTLYQGHSYLYWGLFPALLLAAVKTVLRLSVTVGDEVLVFVALVARALAGGLLLVRLARRMDPRPGPALVALAFLVLALANPTPYLLARAAVYEAAIAVGGAFVLLGLVAAVEGLFADDARRAARWLAAATTAFALAAASRVPLWPMAAALTGFLVVVEGRRRGATPRRLAALAVRLGAPVAVILVACLGLNHARFGAWTEFGTTYQVGFPFTMGARFVPANALLYLLQPARLSCRFPFIQAPWDESRAFAPGWVPWPADFRATEPVTGMLWAAPFVVLSLAVVFAWRTARRGQGGSASSPFRACGLLAVGALTSALPILTMFSVSQRYETDVLTFLLPLAALGGWWLVGAATSPARRRVATTLFVTLALTSVLIGMGLGFTGYFKHFERHNHRLMERLTDKLSLCR